MAIERDSAGRILPGSGGRQVGSRNKLQAAFVEALQKDFGEHGEAVIRIVRIEKPAEYLKILAGILPKEMLLTNGDVLDDLSDSELQEALTIVRQMRAAQSEAQH